MKRQATIQQQQVGVKYEGKKWEEEIFNTGLEKKYYWYSVREKFNVVYIYGD